MVPNPFLTVTKWIMASYRVQLLNFPINFCLVWGKYQVYLKVSNDLQVTINKKSCQLNRGWRVEGLDV
jgi:hypothetical protein